MENNISKRAKAAIMAAQIAFVAITTIAVAVLMFQAVENGQASVSNTPQMTSHIASVTMTILALAASAALAFAVTVILTLVVEVRKGPRFVYVDELSRLI
jgi:hypothetical protein